MHACLSRRYRSFLSTTTTTTTTTKLRVRRNSSYSSANNYKILQLLRNNRLDEARQIFNLISSPTNIQLYTMMISAYTRNRYLEEALTLFHQIPITVRDVVSWNSLMKGCLECGRLDIALNLFNQIPKRNVVSWTTIISGYSQSGDIGMAEEMFNEMPWSWRDTAAWNSMLFGYCTNGRIGNARDLFEQMPQRNVISWTTMISGLDQSGKSEEALGLFKLMQLSDGVEPTSNTISCALTACANLSALRQGTQLHAHLVKLGYYASDVFILATLITFYANCRLIESSHKVFLEETLLSRNVVIWTALLTGYSLNGKHEEALGVFRAMMGVGITPNQSTFTSALNSCCEVDDSLDIGTGIHTQTIKLGVDLDVFVGNSLIVMYSKCGDIDDGLAVFNNLSKRNLVTWNSVIVGCAQHGHGILTLELFDQMIASCATEKVKPDEITFVGLLTACSRSRMLEKAKYFFELLNQDPSLKVTLEHYVCMVDVLGRSGKLEEAEDFIIKMPVEANSTIWLALLSACRAHSNLPLATRAAQCIWNLEPQNSAAYVLLSNIYASAGRWNDVSRIREMMEKQGIVKKPGSSWFTHNGRKHKFLCGDTFHPLSDKIYQKLDMLGGKIKELGYVPNQKFALHDVEDEQKEMTLSYHSERLAIGFGLVTSVEGSTIRVATNLRVCGDCHSFIKLMTKVVGRKILVRDPTRSHHFKDGNCSCGDYW